MLGLPVQQFIKILKVDEVNVEKILLLCYVGGVRSFITFSWLFSFAHHSGVRPSLSFESTSTLPVISE